MKQLFKTFSDKETREVGKKMAQSLTCGSLLALVGDLGSGKTCFVQGLALGLGIPETISITSPTFVLIHEYPGGKMPLYHFDFYRLGKENEVTHLNFEEYWEGAGISVVEWADRFPNIFPQRTQWIRFRILGQNRREIITIPDPRSTSHDSRSTSHDPRSTSHKIC